MKPQLFIYPMHVHPVKSATSALVWPCLAHEDGRIPKDVLYGELASGARCVGRPALRFRDACKRNIKSAQVSIEYLESTAADRNYWRQAVQRKAEERRSELFT